jgi:DNA-binding LytR/AlgR family response regulator
VRTVIIEDESLAARDLKKLLHQVEPEMKVEAVLPGIEAARNWFASNPEPDLLFMDIQLSDGVSFDLFNYIKLESPVIFTTAYNEYAIKAFKVNSIDYLLKPIDRTELAASLEKFKKLRQQNNLPNLQQQIQVLLGDLKVTGNTQKYKERFMGHYRNTLVPVQVNRVACFMKEELIYMLTFDNQKMITDFNTMEEVEQLINPSQFFRANRQFIIHINTVDSIKHGFNGKIIVKLRTPINLDIDVSREKASLFKEWIN